MIIQKTQDNIIEVTDRLSNNATKVGDFFNIDYPGYDLRPLTTTFFSAEKNTINNAKSLLIIDKDSGDLHLVLIQNIKLDKSHFGYNPTFISIMGILV